MRAASIAGYVVFVALGLLLPVNCAAVEMGVGTFLTTDNTLATVRCLGKDRKPTYWRGVSDGVLDRVSYVETTLKPVPMVSVVQCRDLEGDEGTLDGAMPPNAILQPGTNITYIDVVTISLPRRIVSVAVDSESYEVRASTRGVIVALPGFMEVFRPTAILTVAVRAALAVDKPGFGAAQLPPLLPKCSVAYMGDDAKALTTVQAHESCIELLYASEDNDAIYAHKLP